MKMNTFYFVATQISMHTMTKKLPKKQNFEFQTKTIL